MKQEDKELLLKDLCVRLPYGVKVLDNSHKDYGVSKIINIGFDGSILIDNEMDDIQYYPLINNIKPYLRPISSMTEEEVDNLFHILKINEKNAKEWLKVNDIGIIRLFTEEGKDFYEIAEAIDYLNSIHIDYRELIEKGLALEAPEEIY